MHISLPLGNNLLMGSDILESPGQKFIPGNNLYLTIEPDSKSEAEQIFNSLSAGGVIEMNLEETFWDAYYGAFKDQFGVQWRSITISKKGLKLIKYFLSRT